MKNDTNDDFDIIDKIVPSDKEFGFRQLSLQISIIKGNFSFEKSKQYLNRNLISDSINNEGFERSIQIRKPELIAYYCKEGKRTNRFSTPTSKIIPKTLKVITEYCTLRFLKESKFKTTVYIYGGSERFIDSVLKKVLKKIAIFSGCKLINAKIPQLLIRRLCLTSHRNSVELIKIDPSKSKNYAKILKEEETEKQRYEFVIKEGLFKGHKIMNSSMMIRLFSEEPNIDIVQFKSSFEITLTKKSRIKYELTSNGKINFSINQIFMNNFADEFEATEYLLERLEKDARSQILLTETRTMSKGQQGLPHFLGFASHDIDSLFSMLNTHMNNIDVMAISAILSDLRTHEHSLKDSQKIQLGEYYFLTIKNDPSKALELSYAFHSLISEPYFEEKSDEFVQLFRRMNSDTLLAFTELFLNTNMPLFNNIIRKVFCNDFITKKELQLSWNECLNEKNSNKKGRYLELFLAKLFVGLNGIEIDKINRNTKSEEIDLTLINRVKDTFWMQFNSPFIFVEAKNWTNKVSAKEVKLFKAKVSDHINHTRMGFFIAINGFTKGSDIEQIRSVKDNSIIVLITGNDVVKYLDSDLSLRKFLEKKIGDAIK